MVPAGLMPAGADQTVLLEGDASDAVGVGITIEPEGGSKEPSLPSGRPHRAGVTAEASGTPSLRPGSPSSGRASRG